MPDERREIRIKRPASHNALDGSPFISRGGGERKRGVTELVPDSKDGCDIRHRPRGSLENEIGPKRECPRMVDENSREAAKECSPRRKPWVGAEREPALEGRKTMSHTCGNILLHLIFSTRERHPLIETGFRSELFAYLGGIVREMQGTGSGRTCPRRKNKFLSLGSRKMEPKFWMANRLRSFQRQRIECRGADEIYRQPGRTSQKAFISG